MHRVGARVLCWRDAPTDTLAFVADKDEKALFERHVDRNGVHHLWLGSTNAERGTGRLKVSGKNVTAHRRAWELAFGLLAPGQIVLPCPEEPRCVFVDHLKIAQRAPNKRPENSGRTKTKTTRVQVQVNGERMHRRVRGDRDDVEHTRALLREQLRSATPSDRDATRWTLDDLVRRYLEYLEDQGKERRTLLRYEGVAKVWLSPVIGDKAARRLTADEIDRCFARMRKAGQSASSMNQAKALLSGAYKWGKRTGKVLHNPMAGFQLPKSKYLPRERLPPEAADISLILNAAWNHTPDVAPILTLAATTGARLSELVAPKFSDIKWDRATLMVNTALDVDGSIKGTKRAEHRREIPLDDGTLAVLRRQIDESQGRASVCGIAIVNDPFLFSLEPDSSQPMLPGYVTKRLQVLKGHLGVEDKRPETIALEDEALRLRRFGNVDRRGRRGPPPSDGNAMSYDDISAALGRTQMWARRACDAAIRREQSTGRDANFNLSFNGFRKFTSSELLDAGFNLNVVAQRQGHSPEVLTKHYSKARLSARRKAADHLGRVVHGSDS